MISRWARTWSTQVFQPLLSFLQKLGVTANMLTLGSLIAAGATGLLIGYRLLPWAALVLVISGLLDSLDGELARFSGQSTKLGGFIDSICDHYGDFGIYLGIMWFFMNQRSSLGMILVFASMFGSLIGSQVRSRAGMVGIETRTVGIFTRMERTLVLLIGLITNQLLLAMVILALGTNFSALERLIHVLRKGQN